MEVLNASGCEHAPELAKLLWEWCMSFWTPFEDLHLTCLPSITHAHTHKTLAYFLILCLCFSVVALVFLRIIDSWDGFIDTLQLLCDTRARENWILHSAQWRRIVTWPGCLYKSNFVSSRDFGQGSGIGGMYITVKCKLDANTLLHAS
jgi:hypothetical protein